MNWIPDFIKQLRISVALALAVFIATAVVLTASGLGFSALKPVPNEWQWLLVLACVFSGCLIVFRLVSETPKFIRRCIYHYYRSLKLNPPSNQERILLGLIAITAADGHCDMRTLTDDNIQLLEFLNTRDSLVRKGLLVNSLLDSRYVWLTDKGREIGRNAAIEIQRVAN